MMTKEHIVRSTLAEIKARLAKSESLMDWQRIDATSAAEIEAQAQEDEMSDEWRSDAMIPGLPRQQAP